MICSKKMVRQVTAGSDETEDWRKASTICSFVVTPSLSPDAQFVSHNSLTFAASQVSRRHNLRTPTCLYWMNIERHKLQDNHCFREMLTPLSEPWAFTYGILHAGAPRQPTHTSYFRIIGGKVERWLFFGHPPSPLQQMGNKTGELH